MWTEPFRWSPELETLPRERLRALQSERLVKVVARAYARVPSVRAALDAAGVSPADVRSVADLPRLPFTTKDTLRQSYPFGTFAVPREQLVRLHASSGTTGKPTVVGYTRADLDVWSDLMARSLAAAGVRPGDLTHNAYGYGLFTGGLGFHQGAERLGCTVTPAAAGQSERHVLLLRDLGARVLFATPSYALTLAEVAAREGVSLSDGPLAIGVFGGEPWSEAMRAELDLRLGIRSVDMYGLSELQGPGVAIECAEARSGLHGWEDNFVFEVIDPDSGEVLPMGQEGELVITTLAREAQPMLRYRTRDITRLSDAPCPCGRTHVRILRVTGRNDDMLIIRGVNVYPSQVEAALVGLPGLAPFYRLVLQREGTLDALTVEVEALSSAEPASHPALAAAVARELKARVGIGTHVVVLPPGELPRSEGKAVRVRDLR
jgi:phenylacetate-CoA ligase